jgi:HK97 family phage major capsid protein
MTERKLAELREAVRTALAAVTEAESKRQADGTWESAEDRSAYIKAGGAVGDAQAALDGALEEKATADGIAKAHDAIAGSESNPLPRAASDAIANGDAGVAERKMLTDRGWELKSGMWHGQSSRGQVELYPDEVLFGDEYKTEGLSDDEVRFIEGTRATFAADYRRIYRKTLRRGAQLAGDAGGWGAAMAELSGDERKALSEGVDTAGGFLVPPEEVAEILSRRAAPSNVLGAVTTVTTSRDMVRWPMVQAAAAADGPVSAGGASIWSSGFVGDFAGETPAFSDTDPAFGVFEIPIKKIRVATKLSSDFINDSAAAILAFLSQNGGENMNLVREYAVVTGSGAALQPRGIINAPGVTTVDVEGSTTDTISNTTANTGSAPKIIDLIYALPAQYAASPAVMMTRGSEGKVRKLVDGNGRYLWGTAGFGGVPGELEGATILSTPFAPEDGTNANKVFTFGDFSAYIAAIRSQVSSRVLNERFADTDQVGIILFARFGGDLWNPDALRFGIV